MKKRIIAIVSGGDSSELPVSLKSAQGIFSFMDHDKYDVYIVEIQNKQWNVRVDEKLYPIDKNDFSFEKETTRVKFDFAYITIHGTPGENGLLQGYFELIGLPYSSCDVFASALTFNKFACNQYLKGYGVKVSESLLLRKGQSIDDKDVVDKIGLPCFIKPNLGGSSFGVSKVKKEEEIQAAIQKAFEESDEVMIEAFMEGTEITCGCYKIEGEETLFPITEVVAHNDFFDFDAKYNGQVDEITPARISQDLTERVQKLTSIIYDIIGCSGIIRVDFIISDEKVINLLEINTTPGMTSASFIPQQIAAAGLDIKNVMTDIIENKFH